ncbi:MAG: IS21 family transposase [Bacteroidetes bacterium]|nr:IS21 family transposase [Bacteroidota bacterium]
MINIRHILRLHSQHQTMSEIMVQTGIHKHILKGIIKDFKTSKLSFLEINELTDEDLIELFKRPIENPQSEKLVKLYTLFPEIDKELKKKGVTKGLLFDEYKKQYPDGAGRSAFLHHFSQWKARKVPIMRQNHKAGDKLFIDFAGEKLHVRDKESGKDNLVEVFVAVLGASQITYVEAVMSQKKEDFIPACENALHFLGGVPAAIVPDNLRSAVTKSDKYEPTINETFADFAEHYNTTILPARAYRPTDKAVVENTIKIIYTRIYAPLRNTLFFSLEDLNAAILIPLIEHNDQTIIGRGLSRRQHFEEEEKTVLGPLPAMRYEFKKQLYATVGKNGHVALSMDRHHYSVPYAFIGKKVKLMFTRYNVEIFFEYERIAIHKRWQRPFKYTTDKEHLPPAHRFVAELESDKILTAADDIHKDVKFYVTKILELKQHPEQLYKVCLGVLSLSKKYGNERLIKACQRALSFDIHNYRIIKKILENGLDKNEEESLVDEMDMPQHNNIRGSDYYK